MVRAYARFMSPPTSHLRCEQTLVINICLFVNSKSSDQVQGCSVAAKHSEQKMIGLFACCKAEVNAKSSLTAPFHASNACTSSKVLRRIAVAAPQQKFSWGFPSRVATAAFQADAMALARMPAPVPRGNTQRYPVVAPIRIS